MTVLTLNLEPITHLGREQFWQLCQANPDHKLELTANGRLIILPPTGWESGRRNADLTTDLNLWNRQTNLGLVFDSSTGFTLANGAIRSPDVAWIRKDRLATINPDPGDFLPLAPDFVIELRSASDRLKPLQEKMQEYLENGVRLGWLINTKNQTVEIYRSGQPAEVLQSPAKLSGEDVLVGFSLDLTGILS
jgi:Uma2 family endonuclease